MKTRILFVFWLCLSFCYVQADEKVSITLDDEHQKQTMEYPGLCNIFIYKGETDKEDMTQVTVQIENLSESNYIILFDRAYSEKNLKSMSIVFHKNFPGRKGERNIESFSDSREIVVVEPGQKRMIPKLQIAIGETKTCSLPLYVARNKDTKFLSITIGKEKMEILDKTIIELDIKVEQKDDEDFLKLNNQYESLVKELSNISFINCPTNKHSSSLKKQEAPYLQKIKDLEEAINTTFSAKEVSHESKAYDSYQELKQKVAEIDLKSYEKKCEKRHGTTSDSHKCKDCSLTLEQIFKTLERSYKKLHQRQISKDEALAEANRLYNACTKGSCPNLKAKWNNGGTYRTSIENYYNRIINF